MKSLFNWKIVDGTKKIKSNKQNQVWKYEFNSFADKYIKGTRKYNVLSFCFGPQLSTCERYILPCGHNSSCSLM